MDRTLFLLTALCVIAGCNARSCTSVNQHTLCVLGPGEIWTPSALNLTGSMTVAGTPGSQASTLDLSFLSRTSSAPGTSLTFQDLTVVTDIALPRANTPLSFLVPSALTGSVNISFERVTLQLPSSCTSLGQYATLLCRGSVNSSLAISRWGVRFTSWATAAVRARHLNLTCGSPLPPSYNMLCTSMPVREATELLAALAATEGMAAGTTSFIYVLSNISLQSYTPPEAQLCSEAVTLVALVNSVIIAGVPSTDNPRPELDWAGWCGLVDVTRSTASLVLMNLTQANLPVGPSLATPLSFFTAAGFVAQYSRRAFGRSGFRFQQQDVTLLLPADEMAWWLAMAGNRSLVDSWCYNLVPFQVSSPSNGSVTIERLQPAPATSVWLNTQLVSVQQLPPSAPLLIQDTGVQRLNGLGPSVFPMQPSLHFVSAWGPEQLLPSPWEASTGRSIRVQQNNSKIWEDSVIPQQPALPVDTVLCGDPYRPQALLMDLVAAPPSIRLGPAATQLTLSSLVLANAAPLLPSLVCGAAARQQGVACGPTADSAGEPVAASLDDVSRAVWLATGLADLRGVVPLAPLCPPDLATALGGLTSLLWLFATPRTHPAQQPPLASAPLVLLNVTLLLPDLEMRAIGELAAGGSTRVNLRADTLDLLRTQLAGQQVMPAAWPPGGLKFPTFSWFGIRGLEVTLAPYTATNPWGEPWVDVWGQLLPQLVPSNLTTMVQPDGPLLLELSPPPPSPSPSPGLVPIAPPTPPLAPASPKPSPPLSPGLSSSPTAHPSPGPPPLTPAAPSPGAPSPSPPACTDCGVQSTATAAGAAVGAVAAFVLLCGAAALMLMARRRWSSRDPALDPPPVPPPTQGQSAAEPWQSLWASSRPSAASLDLTPAYVKAVASSNDRLSLSLLLLGPERSPSSLKGSWISNDPRAANGVQHLHRHHQQQQQQQTSSQLATAPCCTLLLGPGSSGLPASSEAGPARPLTGGPADIMAAVRVSTSADQGAAAGAWGRQVHPNTTSVPSIGSCDESSAGGQAGAGSSTGYDTSAAGREGVLGRTELELELQLEQLLGEGAFGTVYRGTWRGMPVAVKRVVFSGLANQPAFTAQRQQVLMEAELNARLAHPNVVATYAYHFAPSTTTSQGVEDWLLHMVCELCSFGSLADAIEGRKLWNDQLQAPLFGLVMTILGDVVKGMAYIHRHHVMHRDLKPDNVLLKDTPEGVVAKVADLGLGAVIGPQRTHLSNARAGTPLYMAPEVLRGHFSPAADVYSFGVLAWELLHGCPIWERLRQITQEPRYLKGLEPHPLLFQHDWHPQPSAPATPQAQAAARGLRDLVDGCLQPQPSARPSFQDLEHWLVILAQLQDRGGPNQV